MGMIKCQDCGKEISDKVDSCPRCGRPVGIQDQQQKENQQQSPFQQWPFQQPPFQQPPFQQSYTQSFTVRTNQQQPVQVKKGKGCLIYSIMFFLIILVLIVVILVVGVIFIGSYQKTDDAKANSTEVVVELNKETAGELETEILLATASSNSFCAI